MNLFCCKCGKKENEEPIVDGFCLSCYKEEFPLLTSLPEKQLNITTCKLCGDLMFHGKWKEITGSTTPIILEIIRDFISKAKKVRGIESILIGDFEEPPFDIASKQSISVILEGTPKPEVPTYQHEINLDLVVNVGACDRCSKFARGYFESIVQIRGDRRDINEEEQLRISEMIAQKKEESIDGNRMAYISKTVDQSKGGIDLYIGSEEFAKSLSKFLAENLAASIEYSTKLKSMKDGKPIYTSTYCVRVPYFEIGDIVTYQKNPHQITGINFGRVEVLNLVSRETKTLSLKESHPDYLTVLKKKNQLQKYIIMTIQPPNVSIMNSISFETIDIDSKFIFNNHQDGDEILMVELPQGIYECRSLD